MILRKETKQSNFTILDNKPLKDKNLSNEALGVLCRVLSLPNYWNFNMKGLSTVLNLSRAGVNRILKILALYGYFTRKKIPTGVNGFDYEYIFYEESLIDKYIEYYVENGVANIFNEEQLKNLLPEEYFISIRGI